LQPLYHVSRIAHVGADRAAESLAVDAGEMDARIGQRLGGCLPAQGDVLQLAGKFSLDIDRGTKQHAVGYACYAREAADATVTPLDGLPNGLAVSADRRNHADAGDNYRLVLGMGQLH
jgi:hypothetical protein